MDDVEFACEALMRFTTRTSQKIGTLILSPSGYEFEATPEGKISTADRTGPEHTPNATKDHLLERELQQCTSNRALIID